jgi:uncharacterized protein YdhG (YjbR/CyaY superfamily)
METENTPKTIDEYIDLADQNVRETLREIREIIRANAPAAEECISYKIPAFKHRRPFIYFAAFKKHIGVYPPVTNDESLILKLSKYRNEKGNLSFSLKEPIPYELIGQVAKALYKQYAE